MAEQHVPARTVDIDVLAALEIAEAGAFGLIDEDRSRPTCVVPTQSGQALRGLPQFGAALRSIPAHRDRGYALSVIVTSCAASQRSARERIVFGLRAPHGRR